MHASVVVGFCLVAAILASPFRHHHRGPQPCEVPTYLEDLPADAQQKLKDIWKNWKEGDKCYEEQGLTRELLETLPKETRRNLWKSMLPSFLRKTPKEVQDQFKAIWKDRTIAFDDKRTKFYELAQKVLTGDALKEFNEHHAKVEKQMQEYKDKAAKLSAEAREANEKIESLFKQKHEIINSLSESAREELFELWHERFSHHRGGHHFRFFPTQ